MNNTTFTGKHLDCLSAWAGYKINFKDSFDILVESHFDYIELLLLFEKHFALDLLEIDKKRQDFSTVEDFISWALQHPAKNPIPDSAPLKLAFAKHLRQRHFICQQVES